MHAFQHLSQVDAFDLLHCHYDAFMAILTRNRNNNSGSIMCTLYNVLNTKKQSQSITHCMPYTQRMNEKNAPIKLQLLFGGRKSNVFRNFDKFMIDEYNLNNNGLSQLPFVFCWAVNHRIM